MPVKPTKRSSQAKQPNKKKSTTKILNAPWLRPVILLVLVAVVALVVVIVNQNKKSGELSAKETADAAMQAFVDCDATKLQKYYLMSPEKVASFNQDCKPGATYSYSKDLAQGSINSASDNASLEYTLTIPGKYNGRIMVYLVRPDAKTGWKVFSLTPLDFSGQSLL